MPMNDLPGYEWAISHGYTLMATSGDKRKATYANHGVFLDVWDDNTATFTTYVKSVRMSIDKFAFPGNIEMFERQINAVYEPYREAWW